MKNEKIYILGFGAIGKALAVFLASAGKSVVAIRGSVDDGSITHEKVVVALPDGTTMEQIIEVATLTAVEKIHGLIALTTKSFANEALSKTLKSKADQTPVVIMQNGLNVEDAFLNNGFNHIYRCVLFTTSQVLENGVVRFRPVTDSPVGVIKGDLTTLHAIVAQIDTNQLRFKPETRIQEVIWKKAIINTVFNSVCPLLETDNGIFHREPLALQVAAKLIRFSIIIAGKMGVTLDQQDIETSLINISKAADGQWISTLQDIKKGRPIEIDTMNFAIAGMAEKEGIPDISKEIALLGELIRIKAKINLK